MQKKTFGNTAVILLTLLYPILWLTVLPNLKEDTSIRQIIGELLSGSAMILMAIGLVLANRPRWLEDYFGGLDKMYVTHRRMALTAYSFLIVHMIMLFHFPPDQPGRIMGVASLFGFTLLIALTLAPRIPWLSRVLNLAYHHWRNTHRLMGIFFFMGFIHFTWVEPIAMQTPPGFYMVLFVFLGLIAYLYKQIIARFVQRPYPYEVAAIHHPAAGIIELLLKPTGKQIPFQAGQFQFVHFPEVPQLKEPHPFTISSAPQENQLRLAIKASGDWTTSLKQHLKPGMKAKVMGGHGRFNYKDSHLAQIWIAGGIGVTPFRSWVRDMRRNPQYPIHFFYMVRSPEVAVFWDEFEQAAKAYPNFNAHLHLSSKDGRLHAKHLDLLVEGDLSSKAVYLCGPAALINAFSEQLQEMGVPAANIHFEVFNFR
ncbi:MAG: hypothetical protein KC421_00175 [Anaerolineales bacterium]|nr:hypothetical protein [Anaerolineales bacterium]